MKRLQFIGAALALLVIAATGCKKETSLPQPQNLRQTERAGLLDDANDGRVFARIGDTLYCHGVNNGERLWASRCPEGTPTEYAAISPEVGYNENLVYMASGNGIVYAYDVFTGAPKWSYATNGPIFATPLLFNGVLYVPSTDGKVHILNAITGSLYWAFEPGGGGIYTAPIVYGNVLYVITRSGAVTGMDIYTGAVKLRYTTAGKYFQTNENWGGGAGGLTAHDNLLFIQTLLGIEAVNMQTGRLVWKKDAGNVGYSRTTFGACPSVYNGYLYATFGEMITKFNIYSGASDKLSHYSAELGGVSPIGFDNQIFTYDNYFLRSIEASAGIYERDTRNEFRVFATRNSANIAQTDKIRLFLTGLEVEKIQNRVTEFTLLGAVDPVSMKLLWQQKFKSVGKRPSNATVLTAAGIFHPGDSGAQW